MQNAHQILNDSFGYSSFRLAQEAVISRLLLDNEHALVVFPTGGGKSLTYQVPALCLDGLTLVISPLIALMKDQVDALVNRGIKAANLDSTLTRERAAFVKEEALSGSLKLLYVAPERLNNEGFINMISRIKISLLAVDEAHCISQWGASFRPEYLKIARFAQEQNVERVLCLTATATPAVADDICQSFSIAREGVFRTPVFRHNLCLKVEVAESFDQKLDRLVLLLKTCKGPSIVYVTQQKHAETVANHLTPHEFEPLVYHAGLPSKQREEVQSAFMKSDTGIVICTIAFGMGIDKANIRQIIHLYMPKTLENYSQEIGRAGRDGLPSTCTLFLSTPDIPVLEGFCHGDTCAKRDLELWLQEVALKEPAADGTIDFNQYKQGTDYDIRTNVLSLCYAQLELDYSFIRAVTPYYSVYELSLCDNAWMKITSDNNIVVNAIRSRWRQKGNKYHIDVVEVAAVTGIDRAALAKQISDWELDGLVMSKASQVRTRYKVLNALPKATNEIMKIAEEMYKRMVKREEEGIEKLRQVIEFATGDDCLAHNLAKYFGDEDAVPNGMCEKCTSCMTGESTKFYGRYLASVVDPVHVQAILRACPERDDPRLLARMAFGVTSPRLTKNKWSTYHPLFGSMGTVDFNLLVQAFDEECKKTGYQSVDMVPSLATKKRPHSKLASTDYNTRSIRGRGGSNSSGYKRVKKW